MASEGPLPESGGPGVGGGVSLREMLVRQRLREMEGDLLYLGEGFWVVFPHNPEKACCLLKEKKKKSCVDLGFCYLFFFKYKSYMRVCIYVTYKENTCDFNLQLIYTVCIAHLQLANRFGA